MVENTIVLTDEQGNETTFEVILTFSNPETDFNYVLLTNEQFKDEVLAYRYDDNQQLYPIESEEWKMVEDVLSAFNEEEDNEIA